MMRLLQQIAAQDRPPLCNPFKAAKHHLTPLPFRGGVGGGALPQAWGLGRGPTPTPPLKGRGLKEDYPASVTDI